MKIVFFGSSEFAVPSLARLLDSPHKIVGVVTQPDRKKGRLLRVAATPVKAFASSKGIKTYEAERLDEARGIKHLKSFSADLFVVVAFGQILPKSVLEIPKIYSINLHASLLPKYRGAAPINWAVMNGESQTGLTIIKMNEKMDAGDIVLQRRVSIEKEDTSADLNVKFADLGAVLLLDAVKFIEEKRISFKKQDEKKRSLARLLKKEDGLINWESPAVEIYNKIRGTVPWPGAYTYFDGKKINIPKAAVVDGEGRPGEIIEAKNELIVGTKKELLKVLKIQVEGKKTMETCDFLRGQRHMEKGGRFASQR